MEISQVGTTTLIVHEGVKATVYFQQTTGNWVASIGYVNSQGAQCYNHETVCKSAGDPLFAVSPEARTEAEHKAAELVLRQAERLAYGPQHP